MTPTPQVQSYKAGILINGVAYPALAGTVALSCPENFVVPEIIGNYWDYNYAAGLKEVAVSLQLVVRNGTGSGDVLDANFLNWFLTRTNDISHDVLNIPGGITFFDGGNNVGGLSGNAFVVGGGGGTCKANSFRLACSKGDDLIFQATFMGNSLFPTTLSSTPAFDQRPPLRFNNVNLVSSTGNCTGTVFRFELGFTNNLTGNPALDGTSFMQDYNAGRMRASLALVMQALDSPPQNESSVSINIYGAGAMRQGNFGNENNSGSILRTFTAGSVINNTPDDRSVTRPRVLRSYNYICLGSGSTGQSSPPITIS